MTAFRKKKQYLNSLDDIVFEHRNKDYGCYHIRATYRRRLGYSFVLVLFLFLAGTLTVYFWKINPWYEPLNKSDESYTDRIDYDPDLIHIINQLSVVPPDRQIVLSEMDEAVQNREQIRRVDFRMDIPKVELKPVVTPMADTSITKKADNLLLRHKENLQKQMARFADSLSFILEKVPQFPGGNAAIQSYFYKNQHYPEYTLSRGIHGSPIVSFIVSKAGIVENVRVVKGIDLQLDREAVRLVKSMPVWQPALYKGKPVACMLLLPVDFTIK